MATHKCRVLLKDQSPSLIKMKELAKPVNKSTDGYSYIVGFIVDVTIIDKDSAKMYESIHDIYFVHLHDFASYEKTNNPSLIFIISNEDVVSVELFIDNTVVRSV